MFFYFCINENNKNCNKKYTLIYYFIIVSRYFFKKMMCDCVYKTIKKIKMYNIKNKYI